MSPSAPALTGTLRKSLQTEPLDARQSRSLVDGTSSSKTENPAALAVQVLNRLEARVSKDEAASSKTRQQNNLLLKSLRTLQSSPHGLGPTKARETKARESINGLAKALAKKAVKYLAEPEHIDPLPDFGSNHDAPHDHCVIVGNGGRLAPCTEADSTASSGLKARSEQSGTDRRLYPRRDSDGSVTVCRRPTLNRLAQASPEMPWKLHSSALKGALIDVSMTGMALSLAEPLAPDTPILLQVSSRHLDEPLDVAAKVLRCTPFEQGGWRVVCQLDSRLTFEQVHLLGRQMFACTTV